MRAYRVCQSKYAEDLQGTGAKLYGGRWNHIGTPCIYTSESRALSVLEFSVNVHKDFVPKRLSLCVFELDDLEIKVLEVTELPAAWHQVPTPVEVKTFGSDLLKSHSIVRVPSSVIHDEFNYLINPLFPAVFKQVEVMDFVYDLRIKNN